MNKRILELAEQAAEYCKTQPREIAGTMWEEKFAELIVRECARCITQPSIQAAPPYDIAIKALQESLANDMKAYFGINND